MSNVITKTIILNGSKNIIAQYYFQSDGVEGELNNFVLLDPLVDYPNITYPDVVGGVMPDPSPKIDLRITQIWYSFSWFDASLAFADVNIWPVWVLARDQATYADFRYFGGLSDRSSSTDGTGKLMISTSGFAPAGSVGTLVIEARKHDLS